MKLIKQNSLFLAWMVSVGGCWLSFYFREILHIEPCPLCWYQRMAVFPIAIILGMGLFRGDNKIVVYLFPFAVFGFLVAIYQVLGGYFPALLHVGLCGQNSQCSSSSYPLFGFFTLPMLSGLGFLAITYLLFLGNKSR